MDARPIVFLIDDDESFVTSLSRLLQAEGFDPRIWLSPSAFLAQHDPDLPGCLITDLIMPEMDGLEIQQELLSRGCPTPIIFVTAQGDVTTTVTGMRAGAISFLTKPVHRVDLLTSVNEAIDHDTAARAATAERRRVLNGLQSLTPRELQVLPLVAKGLLNKQIAAELGAAEKTIKIHRGRLMKKMRVRSAAALVSLMTPFHSHSSTRTHIAMSAVELRI